MSETKTSDNSNPLHFVLVHGAGHGGWCWYRLRTLMETSGYKVTCLDLKSAGIDTSDANTMFSFDEYNKPLTDFLLDLPENEKVILVGHSAGGLSLTDAIHRFGSKKIRMAIYIAANMLKLGRDDDIKPPSSEYGVISELTYGLGPNKPPTSTIIKKEFQRKLLYNMSPVEDSTLASMLLRPAPLMALRPAQFKQGQDADKIPRVFIKTLNDKLAKTERQDAMIEKWLPSQVFTIESDHSPFFSSPSALFGILVNATSSIQM